MLAKLANLVGNFLASPFRVKSQLIVNLLTYIFNLNYVFFFFQIRTKENDYDWESLVFTMQWPLTACLAWKDERPTHKCILPEQQKWTIHGVWYIFKLVLNVPYSTHRKEFD